MKWICLLAFSVFSLADAAAQQADLLIVNGRILDGTGNSWFRGDIAVRDGKILAIGHLRNYKAARVIDAQERIVAPGFIDVHTHIEDDEVKNPTADNFILDGVTTVVTGNCGASAVDLGEYFSLLDSLRLSVNVASLIGHNDIRREVMGRANREATEAEMQQMEALVDKAMRDGAAGLSTGLIYIPGTYTKTAEIIRLARVAARHKGLYATHMRDEGDSVVAAIEEAIAIGRAAALPVQISHFKLSGQQNWGRGAMTLGLVKKARREGLDVTIDQYPYTASSTSLSSLMPEPLLADGQDSITARLERADVRRQVAGFLVARLKKRRLQHFSYVVITQFSGDTSFNGKSIETINRMKGRPHTAAAEAQTIMDIVAGGDAGIVAHGMSESDLQYFMRYPFNMIASDASIRVFNYGVPHPRGYGTNARVLHRYVGEQGIITLEEAIRRMTSLPAQKFGLRDRGLLREGFAADIVIFHESEVRDRSTFAKPHAYSTGFEYVLVNGAVTVDGGRHTGSRSGRVLHGPGYAKK